MNVYQNGLQARFWARVEKGLPHECWPWLGFRKPSGHGLTSLQSLVIHAHRKAWILINGPIRGDLLVCHRCDNAACCNPAHLYLGTRSDNMIDRFRHTPPEDRGMRSHTRILSPTETAELYQLRMNGATFQECADKFKVHRATVWRIFREARQQKLQRIKQDRLTALSK